MRRNYETEREFAVRAASIHPDIICFNVLSNDTDTNEARKFLGTISLMKSIDVFNSGKWHEQVGFGVIIVHMIDLIQQSISILFGDNETNATFLETIVSWIFGAF